MAHLPEKEVFAKTVYAEARGEPEEGQIWVAWVIKNRAHLNKTYWGGTSIKSVCLHPWQFECWNHKSDISINEHDVYWRIKSMTDAIYYTAHCCDPTGGADHYHNPHIEGHQPWMDNCNLVRVINQHTFYKSKFI